MRLVKTIFLSIIFFLLLNSCDKEKEEERIPILAGIVNNGMLYYEHIPPLELQLQPDSLAEIKSGLDSIDIDLDGNYDIQVRQRMNTDSESTYKDYDNENFPYVGLQLKNDYEVAYELINLHMGKGSFLPIILVDALFYETRIDKIENWYGGNWNLYYDFQNSQIWLWGVPPAPYWENGTWFSLNDMEVYIGIRKKTDAEYKYGWIKVNAISRENIQFLSYAIEK